MSVLTLEDVARTFPGTPPVEALKPCSLSVVAGDLVTITGPSGSGKSTLLNVAGLLDRPTQGSVIVANTDTSVLPEKQRTDIRGRHLGFVFQAFHLMNKRTVMDNVRLTGLYQGVTAAERTQRAEIAITQVGLGHRREYPTDVLSGGERQRVAIARAIAGSPSLLLCDEPTGNLDSENSAGIVELLRQLNDAGMAIVIITHDPTISAIGRTRLAISDGTVTHD